MTAGRRPPGERDLETAEGEADARIRGERRAARPHRRQLLERGAHPAGLDLEAEHLDIRSRGREPPVQLERGDPARAVAEVDDQRVGHVAQERDGTRSTGRRAAAGWCSSCRG